jgi:CubicO group peptidase (beta-lactamase class C family)
MPFAVREGTTNNNAGCGFGLGFSVVLDVAENGVLASEGEYSWSGAASTVFWNDPEEELIVIFMTQFMPSGTYPIRKDLHVMVNQAIVD